ncbi:MAG: hypothetical protein ABIE94_06175 [archaeon]
MKPTDSQPKHFRTWLLAIGIIMIFVFIVSLVTLYIQNEIAAGNACSCMIPVPMMLLILASLGVVVGSFTSYYMMKRFMQEKKEYVHNIDSTLQFLDSEERGLVKTIIAHKGIIKQALLNKESKMDKVKIHRVLKRLEGKGIVVKERDGKINIIKLEDKLKELFV